MNGKQQGVLQQSPRTPDADETIVISLDPESGISATFELRNFWIPSVIRFWPR